MPIGFYIRGAQCVTTRHPRILTTLKIMMIKLNYFREMTHVVYGLLAGYSIAAPHGPSVGTGLRIESSFDVQWPSKVNNA